MNAQADEWERRCEMKNVKCKICKYATVEGWKGGNVEMWKCGNAEIHMRYAHGKG